VDLTAAAASVVDALHSADAVVAVGGRTQWEVGGRAEAATEVSAPAGIVAYDPADLTITVGAGTTLGEVAETVGRHRQQVGLDGDPGATVGGALATGLSGPTRLRHGPVRDVVLELRFVTGDGRLAKAGGPTVKNVTGYDVVRLLVGSLGTLGVLLQATLRCRPVPASRRWFTTDAPPGELAGRLHRPAALLGAPDRLHVLLEGHPDDVAQQAAGLESSGAPPAAPGGPHRGRISVDPARLGGLTAALDAAGCARLAEWGVGTVHVAGDDAGVLARARAIAEAHDGWLLREAGAPDLDGWGRPLPDRDLHRRVKRAFDPEGRLGRGRIPW
jgi:FAD/FMN-containing dehydrogenase